MINSIQFLANSVFFILILTFSLKTSAQINRVDTILNQPDFEFSAPITILSELESVEFYVEAKSHFAEKEFDIARALITRALKIAPENVDYLTLKAWIFKESGKPQRAIKIANEALKQSPTNIAALYCLANARRAKRDYLGANIEYTRLIQLKPDYYLAYYERGLVKSLLNDFKGAIQDFDKCLKYKSTYIPSYLSKGIANFKLFEFDKALVDLNRTIVAWPEKPSAYYYRGLTYLRMNKYAEACEDLNKANSLGYEKAMEDLKTFCFR